jgi:hypothetical protein
MMMLVWSSKTALETMVCGTSGYFAILAAALKALFSDCSSPDPEVLDLKSFRSI